MLFWSLKYLVGIALVPLLEIRLFEDFKFFFSLVLVPSVRFPLGFKKKVNSWTRVTLSLALSFFF